MDGENGGSFNFDSLEMKKTLALLLLHGGGGRRSNSMLPKLFSAASESGKR
jgi:hypothetical protein